MLNHHIFSPNELPFDLPDHGLTAFLPILPTQPAQFTVGSICKFIYEGGKNTPPMEAIGMITAMGFRYGVWIYDIEPIWINASKTEPGKDVFFCESEAVPEYDIEAYLTPPSDTSAPSNLLEDVNALMNRVLDYTRKVESGNIPTWVLDLRHALRTASQQR